MGRHAGRVEWSTLIWTEHTKQAKSETRKGTRENVHKQCLDSLRMKIPLSLQHPLHSKQQIIVNFEAKIERKSPKNFVIHLRRHNHSYLWNYFQLDSTPNGLSSFDTGLPSSPNLLIWIHLPEHHNLLNSAIRSPVPQSIRLLTKFLSWNNHPAAAVNH